MSLDTDKLQLSKAESMQTEPFVHLQQLYEFEFSPITGSEINGRGLYDQTALKKHWCQQGVDIYVFYYEHLPIGFSVVNLAGMIDHDPTTRDIAEFFVMPTFRKQGAGEWMAHKLFKAYQGKWQVRQLPGLEQARAFWCRVIDKFTKGHFQEIELNNDAWQGTVQMFVSGPLAKCLTT